MRTVMDLVQRAAAGRCGILICGERGTGREMIARAIHAHGANRNAPFVKVDCSGPDARRHRAAVLRRHQQAIGRAAHPSAAASNVSATQSRLHDAADGILFLENATELPARVQARLVRVLRDREVFVGDGRDPLPLDVRPSRPRSTAPSTRRSTRDGFAQICTSGSR